MASRDSTAAIYCGRLVRDAAQSVKSYTKPTWRKNRLMLKRPAPLQAIWILVPLVGFELTTYRLQGGCSTN